MVVPKGRRSQAFARPLLRRLLLAVLGLTIPTATVMTVLAKPPETEGVSSARLGRAQARIRRPFVVGEGQEPVDRKGHAFSQRRRDLCEAEPPRSVELRRCDLRIVDLH